MVIFRYIIIGDHLDKYETLASLMRELEELDDGDGVENLKRQLEVIEDIRRKVDVYKFVMDQLELQAEYLKKREDGLKKTRKRVESSIDKIRARLRDILIENQTDRIVGNDYEIRTKPYQSFGLFKETPSEFDLLTYGSQIVKTSLSWNVNHIKDLVRLDSEEAKKLGEFSTKQSIVIKERTKHDDFE